MSMKSERRRRGRMCGRWNLVIPLRRQSVGIHATIAVVLINWGGPFSFFPSVLSLSLSGRLSFNQNFNWEASTGGKRQGKGGLCSQRQVPDVMQKLLGFLCSGQDEAYRR